jgi:16S rRNA (guanine(966)-N(2))-methyltransferase RsmD
VLDLYAGSGALAFESLSRGAARAVLVEKDRAALATIAENARALEVGPRISVVQTAVERAKERLSREAPFDLIFADPPWATVTDGAALAAITPLVSLFAEGATFVLEHAASDEPPTLAGLELDDARRYGDTRLSFYATYETATAPGGTEHNR